MKPSYVFSVAAVSDSPLTDQQPAGGVESIQMIKNANVLAEGPGQEVRGRKLYSLTLPALRLGVIIFHLHFA